MSESTYCILDSGDGRKLEQIGPYKFIRPAAGAVWQPQCPQSLWQSADAEFERYSGGEGKWFVKNKKMESHWTIQIAGIKFKMQRTDFGHLGIFPEQKSNWQEISSIVSSAKVDEFKVLNLFAYTGGSTLAAALAGAKVTHVDASKTSVAWARENAQLSSSNELPIRWITDDVQKYVAREVKRGSRYHGIILDPPTYGRGTKNEVWKIEQHTMDLLHSLRKILADDFRFFLLSAHSQGYTPQALTNMVRQITKVPGEYIDSEMILPSDQKVFPLPSGASCLFKRKI